MRCVIVSHTHWDREWYKTFQVFRARLVDTVDRVLDLMAEDPGYFFQLDGQTIVVEDYLEIRPERRDELVAACRAGRIAVGPWYVQPDSLIPTGETHVRNLLEGRRVAEDIGVCSRIAYTPDSFGHPAQFPQLLGGFGLGPFVYWRGNADEIAELPADYRWRAPDGSELLACHLGRGYFPAWGLQEDREAVAERLEKLARELAERSEHDCVLLMNGLDHALPDDNTREAAEALAEATGWDVQRGLLDDYAALLTPADGEAPSPSLPVFRGEMLGGRVAHLLPGVWSTHVDLKLANRRCESALLGWTEPWAALGELLGTPDERPALRLAWRELLPNQAHDSICGCSQDRVHVQMASRYDSLEELAHETTSRLLERIAGLGVERQLLRDEKSGALSIAVFNPSPHPRSDWVRLPLDGFPAYTKRGVSPLLAANAAIAGFRLDDQPARVVRYPGDERPRLAPDLPVHDLEFVARDVPAFGWRRFALLPCDAHPEQVDEGREIRAGDIEVRVRDDGCLDVCLGEQRFEGLADLEDVGDRGDTYDFDPVPGGEIERVQVRVERRCHPGGIQELEVSRVLRLPARLVDDRGRRSSETVELPVTLLARVAPHVPRVDLGLRLENTAEDHRLRLLFPSGRPAAHFEAATTFDTALRSSEPRDGSEWLHPAPSTFPQQGWVHVNGLSVAAPGLLEAEVTPGGTIALTLLRATGWLSRPDLETRQGDAGPSLRTPGAQCPGVLEAKLSLFAGLDPAAAHDAELGLHACGAGQRGLIAEETALLEIEPREILLSALKPAERAGGSVLRLLNPTDRAIDARVRLAVPLAERIGSVEAVALDESPTPQDVAWNDTTIELTLAPHALRSLLLRHAS